MFSKIYNSLTAITYPQACQVCADSVENLADGVVCGSCWERTRIFSGDETLCRKCGRFLKHKSINPETVCHRCDEHHYDRAAAVGLYERALSASVLNLKQEPFVAKRLQEHLVEAFIISDFGGDPVVVPVPLSRERSVERGFNQAEILARILSERAGLALDDGILERSRHDRLHRTGLDKRGRELSVKDAFSIAPGASVVDRSFVLVDDVLTSGATASNCAKALKQAGAYRVFVLTLARAF